LVRHLSQHGIAGRGGVAGKGGGYVFKREGEGIWEYEGQRESLKKKVTTKEGQGR